MLIECIKFNEYINCAINFFLIIQKYILKYIFFKKIETVFKVKTLQIHKFQIVTTLLILEL